MADFGNMILYSIAIGGGIMGLVAALTIFMQQRESRSRRHHRDDDHNVGTNINFNLGGSAKDIFNDEDLDIAFDGIKLSLKQKVEVEKKTMENGKEVTTKKKKVRSRYLLDGSLRGCASAGRMLAISKCIIKFFLFNDDRESCWRKILNTRIFPDGLTHLFTPCGLLPSNYINISGALWGRKSK